MKLLTILVLITSFSSLFAGEMKKIDYATRETVADAYYTGYDQDEYYDFMYSEIWGVKLNESNTEDCLVITTGWTTETVLDEKNEVKFSVCINKLDDGSYTGFLL